MGDGFSWTQFGGAPPGIELVGSLMGLAVADAGCGTGRTAAALAASGARVTGVDVDAEAVRRADAQHGGAGVRFVVADATAFLSAHRAGFDMVVSKFGALDFAPLDSLLAAVRRALRPDGRLVASSRHPAWERTCRHLGLAAGRATGVRGDCVRVALPTPRRGDERWVQRNMLGSASWRDRLRDAGYHSALVFDVCLPRATLVDYLIAEPGTATDAAEVVGRAATLEAGPCCTVMVASSC